jgi:hypothetical protein
MSSAQQASQRQHFIPATHLARFSFAIKAKRRKSPLWAMRRGVATTYNVTAEKVAYGNDHYLPRFGDQRLNPETIWQGYERHLDRALDTFVNQPRDMVAGCWAQILVPFAASALVRGPEFLLRHQLRTPWLSEIPDFDPEDNARSVIWIELQRLLTQVMVSEWQILRSGTAQEFVLNDRGWFCSRLDGHNNPGYVIPISPREAIKITPHISRQIARAAGLSWVASGITERTLNDEEMNLMRICAAEWAADELYARTEEVLPPLRDHLVREGALKRPLQRRQRRPPPASSN